MNISQRLRTCAKHTALDAVIELLNEAADEIDALHARANGQATQPAEMTDEQCQAFDQIMEQAQVFASAWALVGGRFDSGDALDDAHEAKEELSKMVARAILALRPVLVPMTDEQVDAFTVNGRLHWLGKRQLIRAVEAYYGITAQAKKETP